MKKIIFYILLPVLAANIFFNESLVSRAAEAESNFTNLIVFAKFSGEDEFIDNVYENTTVRKITDNSYNTAVYNVADYFQTVSSGKLRMNSVYLFAGGGSLTLSHPRGYYAKYDEDNLIGYQDNAERNNRMYDLKLDWSQAINDAIAAGNRITNYDGTREYSYADLDKNGDGIIDAITIIYKNTTQSNISVDWASPLWNYEDYANYVTVNTGSATLTSANYVQLTNSYVNGDGDTNGYLYRDETGNFILSLGTIIHETGHIMGLKDLYKSANASPVYFMSVMAKPISPVPQFISVKEQEALGWINAESLPVLASDGNYSLAALGTGDNSIATGYKMDVPGKDKTLYLEYRNFTETGNNYDSQIKSLYKVNGSRVDVIPLKSGLVCYLIDSGTKFPNNMNSSASRWNYEVLGGENSTKNDAALAVGDDILITEKISITVTEITDNVLTFEIKGIGAEHIHTGGEATCIARAVCSVCQQAYGEIDPDNHKNTELRGAKEPSSTENGYTGDLYCKDCGKELQKGTSVPKTAPSITEGKDAQIDATTAETVTFRSDAAFDDFIRVELDGKEIARDADYTVEAGSIIVHLLPKCITTLTDGKHTIGIVSDGGVAETEFTVTRSTENPTVTSKPTETKEPTPTEAPAVTEAPGATKEPTATEVPGATKEPTTTETPSATKEPAATEAPAVTKEPTPTESPSATKEPAATEAPSVTKTPASTETSGATKAPLVTKAPVTTATPDVTKAPSTSTASAGTGTTSENPKETERTEETQSSQRSEAPTAEPKTEDSIVIGHKQDVSQPAGQAVEEQSVDIVWLVIAGGGLCAVIAGWIAWVKWKMQDKNDRG